MENDDQTQQNTDVAPHVLEGSFREAAACGDMEKLTEIVESGVDVNSQSSLHGCTALHWATIRNHTSVVAFLLTHGADKNIKNFDGNIPAELTSDSTIHQLLGEIVLRARVANVEEQDYIEIELDRSSLTFDALLNLLCQELNIDKRLVYKIRKLPNTIIRKDKDVKRLVDFQELELILTNKAISASSRTYGVGTKLKSEQILY
uniref:Uncharacterized protein n=1 Tax=Octopus bimaculoides TaxID=37653 RepID=A0A0L8HHF2_OCTBM